MPPPQGIWPSRSGCAVELTLNFLPSTSIDKKISSYCRRGNFMRTTSRNNVYYANILLLICLIFFEVPCLANATSNRNTNIQTTNDTNLILKINERMQNIENNFNNYKEIQSLMNMNLNKAYEIRTNSLHTLIDIQGVRINDISARFPPLIALIGIAIATIGYITYSRAVDKAKNEVQEWFEKKEKTLQNLIDKILENTLKEIDKMKSDARTKFDESFVEINSKAENALNSFLNTLKLQDFGKISNDIKKEITDHAQELVRKSEDDYTINDWFVTGMKQYSDENYIESIKSFDKIIQNINASNEQIAKALIYKSYSLREINASDEELGVYSEIIRRFEKSIDPKLQEYILTALLNKGVVLNESGQTDKALEHYNKVLSLTKDNSNKTLRNIEALALFNMLNFFSLKGDLTRRDALLDELRTLAKQWPDDAAVREALAKGLYNTLNDSKAENDLTRRDALLDELRALAKQWPDDAAVRRQLAMGLFNTLNSAKEENDLTRRDALLDELRTLAKQWPDDAAVREALAKGLYRMLNDTKAENDLTRRDALLDELRTLATAYPEDKRIQEVLEFALKE